MRGRCNSMVNRVVRSTSVPMAELPRPRMRSPSQCPGTARSATSTGRWLIMISEDPKFLPLRRVRALRHSEHPAGAQTGCQFATERASTLDEQRLVDSLVADAHRGVVRKVDRQAASDLLRAPGTRPSAILPPSMPSPFPTYGRAMNMNAARSFDLPGQPVLNIGLQGRVQHELCLLWSTG